MITDDDACNAEASKENENRDKSSSKISLENSLTRRQNGRDDGQVFKENSNAINRLESADDERNNNEESNRSQSKIRKRTKRIASSSESDDDSDVCFSLPVQVNDKRTTKRRLNTPTQIKTPEKGKSVAAKTTNNIKEEEKNEEDNEFPVIRRSPRKSKKPVEIHTVIQIDDSDDDDDETTKKNQSQSKQTQNDSEKAKSKTQTDESRPTTSKSARARELAEEIERLEDVDDDDSTSFSILNNFRKDNSCKKIKKSADNRSDSSSENEEKSSNKRNAKRKRWDDKEILYLVYGVQILGEGSWVSILDIFRSKFVGRTNVDLKDKYRNLYKDTRLFEMYKKQARVLASKMEKEVENKDLLEKLIKKKKSK